MSPDVALVHTLAGLPLQKSLANCCKTTNVKQDTMEEEVPENGIID